jgi:hypothetical protein
MYEADPTHPAPRTEATINTRNSSVKSRGASGFAYRQPFVPTSKRELPARSIAQRDIVSALAMLDLK